MVDGTATTRMAQSEQVEALLDRYSVPRQLLRDVPLTQINEATSLATQARVERESPEHVDGFVAQMLPGDVFPAVVAERNGHGLTLLDGLHRFRARQKLGMPTIDAYLVDIQDDYVRDLFVRTVNTRNGETIGREERLAHAMYLLEKYPQTVIARVAEELGVNANTLSTRMRRAETIRTARECDKEISHLPPSAQDVLSLWRHERPVLAKAIEIMERVRHIAPTEIAEALREANREKAEADKLAKLDVIANRPGWKALEQKSSARRGRTQSAPKTRLLFLIGQIDAHLTRHDTPGKLDVTSEAERCDIRKRWVQASTKLTKALK